MKMKSAGALLSVLAVVVSVAPAQAQADSSDLKQLVMLQMARDVGDRCGLLSRDQRAKLDKLIDYGLQKTNLSPAKQKSILDPSPENRRISCKSDVVARVISRL